MNQPFFKDNFEKLFLVAKVIVIFIFLVLLLRSFDLTIIQGEHYLQRSENNRLRKISLVAPRGRILTQSGEVLVDNLATYTDSEGFVIDREKGLFKKANGEEVVDVLVRRYHIGEAAAHLTGYLGEATEQELGEIRCPEEEINYQLHDQVGRGGLEEEYDCLLTGKKGEQLVEVDSRGRIVRELGGLPAQVGQDLVISLDFNLQNFIWEKLKELKGAVVVLEAKTGQVLALVSTPSFDPNVFGFKKDEDKIQGYLADKENTPFLNRTLGGAYPPGSVFKPVVAIAALEEGKINPQTTVIDSGPIKIGEWQYTNWYWNQYGGTEGEVDLTKGLQRSNDIYFYKIGEWLGANNLFAWGKKFGLGKKTGIDLPAESSGLMPSPDWKKKVKGEPWFLGNTYHLAIGQGDLTASPLQVATFTGAIANGGKLCPPQLKLKEKEDCIDLKINQNNLKAVQKGMIAACELGGTGFSFFNFKPQVGCKTGTAQVGGKEDQSHAWFSLFAPVADPKVVVVVFVEKGGSGAYAAGPIAKDIVEYLKSNKYF